MRIHPDAPTIAAPGLDRCPRCHTHLETDAIGRLVCSCATVTPCTEEPTPGDAGQRKLGRPPNVTRDAAIVAAVLKGATDAEVASRFHTSADRVTKLMRYAGYRRVTTWVPK